MSLTGAMTSAVTGIQAQSLALGAISDNISNSQTTGYKRVDTQFSTLLTVSNAFVHEPGGVTSKPHYTNALQGTVQQTSVVTNLAVSGEGYFAVSRVAGVNGTNLPTFEADPLYTRAGDFSLDNNGYLVNGGGYFLNGWNVNPTTGQVSKNALVQIRMNQLKSDPLATSSVTYSANLPTTPAQNLNVGSVGIDGQTLTFSTAPAAPAFTAGDTITVTENGTTTTFTMAAVPVAPTDIPFVGPAGPANNATNLASVVTALNAQGFLTSVVNGNLQIIGKSASPITAASMTLASGATATPSATTLQGQILTFSTTPVAPTFTAGDTVTVTQNGVTTPFTMLGGETLAGLATTLTAAGFPSQVDANGNLQILGNSSNPVTGTSATLSATVGGIPLTASSSSATDIQFASNKVNFFDAQGAAHPIDVNWTKVAGTNDTYTVSCASSDPAITSIISTMNMPTKIVFNLQDTAAGAKAGSIKLIDGGGGAVGAPVSIPLSITLGGGTPVTQPINFNLGYFGISEQTTMFTGTDVNFISAQQDGLPPGSFRNLDIDTHGLITLNYDNGARKTSFQVPLVQFSNYDGLQGMNGNAFSTTVASGTPSVHAAGDNGTGTLVASSVEGANVDIAAEFTKLIQTQRAYEANTKVITAVNDLLQQTNNLIR
jgi:flagellar hook protein FlgE